jgi:phosphoglycerate-specific signal transduction histidine kinase
MSDRELRRLLEKLRAEIEDAKSIDDSGRQLLRALDSDIHKLLERYDDRRQARSSIIGRLEEAIEQMEVAHPDLTATLSQMLSILSNAGI